MTGRALLIALSCVAALGCGASYGSTTPEEALTSFARALEDGDLRSAYMLTSERYRARVSLMEFRAWADANRDELLATARQIRAAQAPIEQEASVEIAEGERVSLALDGPGWRVTSDVVDYYSQRTPRDAIRSFVRAVEHRRWDIVLRLVPSADRETMSEESLRARFEGGGREELERLVAGLRHALDEPIEVMGEHAVLPWGDRYRAQLVREGELWVIEDPD